MHSSLLLTFLALWPAQTDPDATARKAASDFLAHLVQQDYRTAIRAFAARADNPVTAGTLETFWKSTLQRLGEHQKTEEPGIEVRGKYRIAEVMVEFKKGKLAFRFTLRADGQIAALSVHSPPNKLAYKAPAYVDEKAFTESEVEFGVKDWELPGTLTMPRGAGPFPAVVLVHGSGPNDRDERIGPQRPFRDLAWGLASRGIAVLRYDKRTMHHGLRVPLKTLTIEGETIEDALEAAAFLRRQTGIDPRRVFVLGHSLGAFAAPEIGRRDPSLRGLILLAGNSRPLEDLLLEQFEYIFSLQGPTEEQKKQLDKLREQVKKVKDPKFSKDSPSDGLPLGLTATYWAWLKAYDPVKTAGKLKMPMLILQGERDYQVTMADFEGWKKGLSGKKNVELKSYEDLNHLFVAGKGKSQPLEYVFPGQVAGKVIDDIAGWIKRNLLASPQRAGERRKKSG